jgi:hypothetical protein
MAKDGKAIETIVRSTWAARAMTALNLDLGRRVWWPSALARRPAPEPGQLKGQRSPVP